MCPAASARRAIWSGDLLSLLTPVRGRPPGPGTDLFYRAGRGSLKRAASLLFTGAAFSFDLVALSRSVIILRRGACHLLYILEHLLDLLHFFFCHALALQVLERLRVRLVGGLTMVLPHDL